MGPYLDVDGHAVWLPGVAVLGVLVGGVAGMFGVGGGFLLTPLLTIVFGVPLEIAVGTGLCQMIGSATAALLSHRRLQQGEIRFDLLALAGCIVGVYAGARALTFLETRGQVQLGAGTISVARLVAMLSYAVLLLGAAFVFSRGGRGSLEIAAHARRGPLSRLRIRPLIDLPAARLYDVSALLLAYVGLALGVLSGFLGLGGGVALMPLLVYGFGFPLRQAAGTGIITLLVTSTVGTLIHARLGHVDLRLAVVLLVGSTLSAQLGARASRRMDMRSLRRLFAGLILLTVLAIAWDLVRRLG